MIPRDLIRNLLDKLSDPSFVDDMTPLLGAEVPWDAAAAARLVLDQLLAQLPGPP